VGQFDFKNNTPKAFANCSPGLSLRSNPGLARKYFINPERVRRMANAFSVSCPFLIYLRRVVAALPWAAISQRLRRIIPKSN
jgi:hypothetical protein